MGILTDLFGRNESTNKQTAGGLFEKYYKIMLPIVRKSPFSHPTDRDELVCSMCVMSDYIAMCAEKDRIEYLKSTQMALRKICPEIDFNKIGERMELYGEVLRGKPLRGQWYMTVGDINKDVVGAVNKITALLGDALFYPKCLDDYFSEERYVIVNDFTKTVAFVNEIMSPLLKTMRDFADELAK